MSIIPAAVHTPLRAEADDYSDNAFLKMKIVPEGMITVF
jgi:hypothetical protein